jgi:hypothetical protein
MTNFNKNLVVRKLVVRENRTCKKLKLDVDYMEHANRLSEQHKKQYATYKCPYCFAHHITTKLTQR